jgi:hypothetical protein
MSRILDQRSTCSHSTRTKRVRGIEYDYDSLESPGGVEWGEACGLEVVAFVSFFSFLSILWQSRPCPCDEGWM